MVNSQYISNKEMHVIKIQEIPNERKWFRATISDISMDKKFTITLVTMVED